MPVCSRCNKLMHAMFYEQDEGQPPKLCLFCHRNVKYITYGSGEKFTKEDAIKEYDIFLKKLSERPSIKEIIETMSSPPDKKLIKVYR